MTGFAIIVASFGPTSVAPAQSTSPVTVDDSPSALLLLQRAADQAAQNPADAIRALQEILDDLGEKLVPASDAEPDRFVAGRRAVNRFLLARPSLLDRYRQVEAARARTMLERGELEALWRTRALTAAGLRAGLLLAETATEQANFSVAESILSELGRHPDLRGDVADEVAHHLRLRGMVAHASGRAAAAVAAIARLEAMGTAVGDASASMLQRMIAGAPVDIATDWGVLGGGVAGPTEQTSWHLIAMAPMPGSLYGRQFAAAEETGHLALRNVDRLRLIGSLLTAAPSVVGDVAFINEGSEVRAFDRLSGRQRWSTTIGSGGVGRDGSPPGDLNAIAISGDRLVTLDGHAHATERSSSARVTCLDVATGDVRWATAVDRLGGPELTGLAPHGAPLIVDGSVFVLARKVTPRFEIVSYLVSLSLRDGSFRWARHLCAAAGARLSGLRPHTTIATADGAIFALLSTGAVARIDAHSGEIVWLVRVPVPIRDPRYLAEPWEIGSAVPTARGVLAIAPDQRRVMLLDTTDGVELESHPIESTEAFGLARYLLVTQDQLGRELVVAVGSDVVAFSGDELRMPLWRLSQREPELIDDPEMRMGVRGRVHVAGENVVIPLAERVLIMGVDDGRLIHEIPVGSAGNPLLVGPQLLLATHNAVECHMPFAAAESLIRDRLRGEPTVAEHGLALVGLGLRATSLQTCLDGAAAAIAAIQRRPADLRNDRDRNELFRLLLTVNAVGLAETDEQGAALHQLIAAIATEPWQRATQRLVRGDWLARRGLLTDALELWQEILDADGLAAALVPVGESRLPGGRAAAMRQRQLIEDVGPEPYAPIARRAAVALERAAESDTTALREIVRRHPVAPVTTDAILRAVSVSTAQRDPRGAAGDLLRGWRDGIGDDVGRLAIAERAIGLAIEARWWTTALDLIEVAEAEGTLPDDASRRWRSRLSDAGGGVEPPPARLGAVAGAGRELRGGVVPSAAGGRQLGFADRLLLADGADLVLIDAELSERWRRTMPAGQMETIIADDRGVVISVRTVDSSLLVALDADTGEERWRSAPLEDLMPPARLRRTTEPAAPSDQVVPLPLADGILLVRRDGTAAFVTLEEPPPAGGTGDWTRVRWRVTTGVREIVAAALHDGTLLVAGNGADGAEHIVVAIDPATGLEAARYRPQAGGQVRWMSVTPTGLAMVGTEGGVEAFDAFDDGSAATQTAWLVPSELVRGALRGWSTPRWLLVSARDERIVPLRLVDGLIDTERFALPRRSDIGMAVRGVHWDRHGVVALFDQRVADFGLDGEIIGMDAAVDDRDYRLMAVADGMLVVVSATGSVQVEFAPGVHRTQYDHRVYLFDRRGGCRLAGPPLQVGSIARRFDRTAAIDGWLMFSSGIATVAVPMPVDPEP